jgi:hypothetical protein
VVALAQLEGEWDRGFRALQSAVKDFNRGFHGDKGDCMIRAVDMAFLSQTG